jgi:hypothetical protein
MRITLKGILGLLAGIAAPFLVLLIFYLNTETHLTFWGYLSVGFRNKLILKPYQISFLANLALFFPSTRMKDLSFGKGILLATIVHGLHLAYLLFF